MKREIWEGRIETVRKEGVDPQVEPSLERWFTKPFRDKNPQTVDRFRKMIKGTTRDGYVGSATAIMEMDSVSQLSRIATPTLVVVGRQDPSTSVSDAELIHQKIAGSQLAVIEDAAHLPNIEQASEFNGILDRFLNQQSARSQERGIAGL